MATGFSQLSDGVNLTEDHRLRRTIEAFEAANSEDPRRDTVEGKSLPHELIDARRLAGWTLKLKPDASVVLRLASYCQHIRRWEIPRDHYPKDRAGYLRWRRELQRFHADTATAILERFGWDRPVIETVRRLNLKADLNRSDEAQVLEDALCLTFLSYEYEKFLRRVDEPKMIGILRKTWKKMSASGRQHALSLSFEGEARRILTAAVASAEA